MEVAYNLCAQVPDKICTGLPHVDADLAPYYKPADSTEQTSSVPADRRIRNTL